MTARDRSYLAVTLASAYLHQAIEDEENPVLKDKLRESLASLASYVSDVMDAENTNGSL